MSNATLETMRVQNATEQLQEQYRALAALCDMNKADSDSLKNDASRASTAADQLAAIEEQRKVKISDEFIESIGSKSGRVTLARSRRAISRAKEEVAAGRLGEDDFALMIENWADATSEFSGQTFLRSLVSESEKRERQVKRIIKELAAIDSKSFNTISEAVAVLRNGFKDADNSPIELAFVKLN